MTCLLAQAVLLHVVYTVRPVALALAPGSSATDIESAGRCILVCL